MMKKLVSFLAIAALTALGASVVFAGQKPRTGVNGSMHDITYLGSAYGYYNQDDYQRVCIFCHTPHNAQPQGTVPAPLWNHAGSPVDLAPYTWAAPANLPINFDVDPLIGPSRLCMGCHDGVTAVDSHGPTMGTAQGNNNGTHTLNSPGRAITDLTVTHPIGFLYADAVAARNVNGNDELVDPTTGATFVDRVLDGVNGNAANNNSHNLGFVDARASLNAPSPRSGWTFTGKKLSDTLYGGYMTCASCHEVHNLNNSENDPSVSNPAFTPNYFVWAREKGSALCLSCHVK